MAERACAVCFEPLGEDADPQRKYCSDKCRQKAHRGDVPVEVPDDTGLAKLVKSKLEAADRIETVDGQQALQLARQMGAKVVNTSGLASLSKEFSRVFAAAMSGVEEKKGDHIDEVAEARAARRRSHSAAV